MEKINDPMVRKMVLMGCAQWGKTTFLHNIAFRNIHVEPCPMLYVHSSLGMIKDIVKEKIDPSIRQTPILHQFFDLKKFKDPNNTIAKKIFPGGHLTFVGANSEHGLQSHTTKYVFFDEIDLYAKSLKQGRDPIKDAEARATNIFGAKIIMASVPNTKDVSRIYQEYLQTDQRKYYVPCPHCNYFQQLKWENIRYQVIDSQGVKILDRSVPVTYICENCGELIDEKYKIRMGLQGKWIPDNPNEKNKIGYYINKLYLPFPGSRWELLVEQWLEYENKKDPTLLRTFINNVMGLPFDPSMNPVNEDRCMKMRYEPDMKDGIEYLPEEVCFLTMGVDTQANRLEYTVLGWTVNKGIYVVEHDKIWGDPSSDSVWRALDGVRVRPFHHPNGDIYISGTAIDSHGRDTMAVYRYTAPLYKYNVHAIRGKGGENVPIYKKPSKHSEGGYVFTLGVDQLKTRIHDRIGWDDQTIWFNQNYCDEEYFKGLLAEYPETVPLPGNQYSIRWIAKKGVRNEPFDCFVYAMAEFEILNPYLQPIKKPEPVEEKEEKKVVTKKRWMDL